MCVGSHCLVVGVVGRGLLDLVEEVLLDVKLSNVGYSATLNGIVGQKSSTVVNDR